MGRTRTRAHHNNADDIPADAHGMQRRTRLRTKIPMLEIWMWMETHSKRVESCERSCEGGRLAAGYAVVVAIME